MGHWFSAMMPAMTKSENSTGSGSDETSAKDADSTSNEAPRALPRMDFSMFVMSLGSTAMVNLGQVAGPDEEKSGVDLPAAKQIIDILGILEEKTRGNLDDSEKNLLSSLLYDLRVHYVDAQRKK